MRWGPRWCPIYGPPNTSGGITQGKASKHMCKYPNAASSYRGRIMLSMMSEVDNVSLAT